MDKKSINKALSSLQNVSKDQFDFLKEKLTAAIESYDHKKTQKALNVISEQVVGFLKEHRLNDTSKVRKELSERVVKSKKKIKRVYG